MTPPQHPCVAGNNPRCGKESVALVRPDLPDIAPDDYRPLCTDCFQAGATQCVVAVGEILDLAAWNDSLLGALAGIVKPDKVPSRETPLTVHIERQYVQGSGAA